MIYIYIDVYWFIAYIHARFHIDPMIFKPYSRSNHIRYVTCQRHTSQGKKFVQLTPNRHSLGDQMARSFQPAPWVSMAWPGISWKNGMAYSTRNWDRKFFGRSVFWGLQNSKFFTICFFACSTSRVMGSQVTSGQTLPTLEHPRIGTGVVQVPNGKDMRSFPPVKMINMVIKFYKYGWVLD